MTRSNERDLSTAEILLRRAHDKAQAERIAKEEYRRNHPLAPQPNPLTPITPSTYDIRKTIYGEQSSTPPVARPDDTTVYIVEGGGERKRGTQSNRGRERHSGRGKFGGPRGDVYTNKPHPYSGGPRGRGR